MTEIGLKHTYLESPGIHDWVFWDAYIEKALVWLDEQ
jgi:S-formylglutathione hydrolase FrmB